MELKEAWTSVEMAGNKTDGWDAAWISWMLMFSTIILTFEETKHFCWPLWGAHGSHAEESEDGENEHASHASHDENEETEDEW